MLSIDITEDGKVQCSFAVSIIPETFEFSAGNRIEVAANKKAGFS